MTATGPWQRHRIRQAGKYQKREVKMLEAEQRSRAQAEALQQQQRVAELQALASLDAAHNAALDAAI